MLKNSKTPVVNLNAFPPTFPFLGQDCGVFNGLQNNQSPFTIKEKNPATQIKLKAIAHPEL
jgi:hypothetical protein